MYETSLSFQTTRAAEQVLQTESRIGHDMQLNYSPLTAAVPIVCRFRLRPRASPS